MQVIITT